MSKKWIVIPAAGQSNRFKEKGYMVRKPFLQIQYNGLTQSMLDHVLQTLPPGTENVILGTPNKVPNTVGQADTVLQLLKDLPANDAVMTLDCDMLLPKHTVKLLIEDTHPVSVVVGASYDPQMSRVDRIPYPSVFVEKHQLSEWAILSGRSFDSVVILRKILAELLQEYKIHGHEPYLTSALNRYPGLRYAFVTADWVDWGTPEALVKSGAVIVG